MGKIGKYLDFQSSQLGISTELNGFNWFLAESVIKMISSIGLSAKRLKVDTTQPSHAEFSRYFESCSIENTYCYWILSTVTQSIGNI